MEDGEIESVSDEEYVTVSRPEVPPPVVEPHSLDVHIGTSSENDDDSNTGSDDSDSHSFRTKRPKYKIEKHPTIAPNMNPTPNLNPFQANPKKKWDIWSKPLQEEVLSETLEFGVDLDPNKMDRSVESYNYKLGFAYNLKKERNSGPRPNEDYAESKFVQGRVNKRKNVKERLGQKKSDKLIYDLKKLKVSPDSHPDVVAKEIANGLMEEKEHLISRVVEVFGKERAIELYNKTRAIEADGGMMVMDMSRRRTPGGVYLKLVASDEHVDQEKIKEILREDQKTQFTRYKKLIAKKRRKKTNAMKEELISNGLLNNDLSDLSIKTDIKEEDIKTEENSVVVKTELCEEINDEQTLTNPPPSPATDQDTPPPPHEREFISYEDNDYLEIETDMDFL